MASDERTHGYLPISAYAAIGDGRTVALVGRDGSIDWCCLPHFDAPAALGRLLDARRGGYLRVAPIEPGVVTRRYRPASNVLETRTRTSTGVLLVTDTMPRGQGRVLRLAEVEDGEVELGVELRPGFDFGRGRVELSVTDELLVARHIHGDGDGDGNGDGDAWLSCAAPARWREHEPGSWRARVRLQQGQRALTELAWAARASSTIEDATRAIAEDDDRWRRWAAQINYQGPFRAAVERSALALRLLVSEPHGALVAAPTTSLPEQIGGSRNWDYRYTWLRDASLVLDVFMRLGMHDEAMSFWDWIEASDIAAGARPRVLYRVDGRTCAPERTLDTLAGYRGSWPVRVGNGARAQDQLDVYGYVIEAAHACQTKMRAPHPDLAPILRALADEAAERWREPDQGIWELRGPAQHNVHSKLMCWIALARAVDLGRRGWLDGSIERWLAQRDAIRAELLEGAWSPTLGAFTQACGNQVIDASVLAIGTRGLIAPDDPRFVSTLDVIRRELERDGLVYRYRSDDGLEGDEGAFVLCSFWLAEALACAGRLDEARASFARVSRRANDVGLFAEQIDPETGEFLGNTPQAFSHLGLIRAALAIAEREPS